MSLKKNFSCSLQRCKIELSDDRMGRIKPFAGAKSAVSTSRVDPLRSKKIKMKTMKQKISQL